MSLKPAPRLGVIRLDYDYPPDCGDIDCPDTFGYSVFYKVVPGLTFDMVQEGAMPEDVQNRFTESVNWLIDEKNVNAITGDCGFMVRYQNIAKAALKGQPVGIVMSSLLQLKSIKGTLGPVDEVMIMTANGPALEAMEPIYEKQYGIVFSDAGIRIVGCENVPGFEAVAEGGKVDVNEVQPGIIELVNQSLKDYPNVRAILLECTELPAYANAIRDSSGLPVWDVISACNYVIAGYLREPRYGTQDWQAMWDGEQEAYSFGQNVSPDEQQYLVNKPAE